MRLPFLFIALMTSTLAARPNVLFIAIDDLNDWVGPLKGHPQARTPAMDKLAARGTVFLNAHCPAPLCNPSRAAIMTGLRPSTTGIYGLAPGIRQVESLKNHVTLPQYFAQHGYVTATCGKVYHDGSIAKKDQLAEFQTWGPAPGMPYPKEKFVNTPAKIKAMDWGVFPEDDREQADWKIADAAIDLLNKMPADKPFFLGCGFRLPHVPCFASKKWFDLYPPVDQITLPPIKPDDRKDIPEFAWYLHWKLPEPRLSWLEKNNQLRPLVLAYLASTTFMDSQIGRVLDALEQSGRAKDTLIVLWSDNGWHLGEKGITGKNTLWDRGTRVPLIFAGPGVSPAAKCSQPTDLTDLYPTLVELCNLPSREGLDGHSLVPQLKDAASKRPWPAITTHNQGNHGIRTEHYRYIHYADGSAEFYDYRNDPNEWTNLINDVNYVGLIREHAQLLPKANTAPVPGSAQRVLTKIDGKWIWEGKPIVPTEKEE